MKYTKKIISHETNGEMQVTYKYYDTFNLMHPHLSRFMKDFGLEGPITIEITTKIKI